MGCPALILTLLVVCDQGFGDGLTDSWKKIIWSMIKASQITHTCLVNIKKPATSEREKVKSAYHRSVRHVHHPSLWLWCQPQQNAPYPATALAPEAAQEHNDVNIYLKRTLKFKNDLIQQKNCSFNSWLKPHMPSRISEGFKVCWKTLKRIFKSVNANYKSSMDTVL